MRWQDPPVPTWADLLAEGRSLLSSPPSRPTRPRSSSPSRRDGPGRGSTRGGETRRTRTRPRAFRALVARRAAGEPLQYLLGEWEFLGRTFRVDPRALIPRGETEAIVEMARAAAPAARAILDAGTGSGILAVSLALERPEARVVAVDRSEAALALARTNARLHGVSGRVSLRRIRLALEPDDAAHSSTSSSRTRPTSRASTRRTSTGPSPPTSRTSPSSAATTASTPSASSSPSSRAAPPRAPRSSSRSATGRPAR